MRDLSPGVRLQNLGPIVRAALVSGRVCVGLWPDVPATDGVVIGWKMTLTVRLMGYRRGGRQVFSPHGGKSS